MYGDGKLDINDIEELNKLNDCIAEEYTRGRINKEQYNKLGEEISINYRKVFAKEIDLINTFKGDQLKQLFNIKGSIEDTYSTGKISALYYKNLKMKISELSEEIFERMIASLNNLPKDSKVSKLDGVENEISNAYSKELITNYITQY